MSRIFSRCDEKFSVFPSSEILFGVLVCPIAVAGGQAPASGGCCVPGKDRDTAVVQADGPELFQRICQRRCKHGVERRAVPCHQKSLAFMLTGGEGQEIRRPLQHAVQTFTAFRRLVGRRVGKKRRERRHARMKRAARRVAGAVWKGKKPLVDSVTSKRKQFEAETKALEDTEMTETGGPQEKTDSDAEAREKHRRKLRLLGKVRERRKDRKQKMTEKREAGSHEEDH